MCKRRKAELTMPNDLDSLAILSITKHFLLIVVSFMILNIFLQSIVHAICSQCSLNGSIGKKPTSPFSIVLNTPGVIENNIATNIILIYVSVKCGFWTSAYSIVRTNLYICRFQILMMDEPKCMPLVSFTCIKGDSVY